MSCKRVTFKMAPTKSTRAMPEQTTTLVPIGRKGLSKRTRNIQDQNDEIMLTRGKRKAENSPIRHDKIKRSALGNLTNNVNTLYIDDDKLSIKEKVTTTKKKDNAISTVKATKAIVPKEHNNGPPPIQQTKMVTRAAIRNIMGPKVLDESQLITANDNHIKDEEAEALPEPKQHKPPVRRISDEFNKTEESLYMSALEEVSNSESLRLSVNLQEVRRCSAKMQSEKLKKTESGKIVTSTPDPEIVSKYPPSPVVTQVPANVEDFDKANLNDPFQVSLYAMDIFNYLKEREAEFPIPDYMPKQIHLSKWMRSLLVDWMVEVQETFELNHETLYLAVKIVDLYLCLVVINKDKLQLLGAAALLIACKYDERTPPFIEDFLYICDGAYKHDELIKMEMNTLKTIGFDLGIPLSYRFLRRYARCAKVSMPTLTLARYILELSLMDYATVSLSDSKLASAALFMALRMNGVEKAWTPTLVHYSGYKLEEFADIIPLLNAGLHRKPKGTIKTIRSKYSHKIFQEAAKVPLLTTETLFEHTGLYHTSIQ